MTYAMMLLQWNTGIITYRAEGPGYTNTGAFAQEVYDLLNQSQRLSVLMLFIGSKENQ